MAALPSVPTTMSCTPSPFRSARATAYSYSIRLASDITAKAGSNQSRRKLGGLLLQRLHCGPIRVNQIWVGAGIVIGVIADNELAAAILPGVAVISRKEDFVAIAGVPGGFAAHGFAARFGDAVFGGLLVFVLLADRIADVV